MFLDDYLRHISETRVSSITGQFTLPGGDYGVPLTITSKFGEKTFVYDDETGRFVAVTEPTKD